MQDDMKEIIDRILPPSPDIFADPEEAVDKPRKKTRPRAADEDQDEEISDEALDDAEENLEADEDLGRFREADYAERIAGWEFKSEELYVEPRSILLEAYYRRSIGAGDGAKWERIGHSRSGGALDLKRLLYCAEQRDARARRAWERRDAIERLFGTGTAPVVESLLAADRAAEAAPAKPLTPRQDAFCRHILTEPSATRAAVMAGYSENGADVQAGRLLGNARILQKISALRRAHAVSYELDRDTMLDKLELVFDEAMRTESHSAALRALLAQAEITGLLSRRHKATERAEARARSAAGMTSEETRGEAVPPLPLAPESR